MFKSSYYLVVCLLSAYATCIGQTKMPSFFSDDMILQQQDDVAIWGTDEPNTTVTIETSWGVETNVSTNENGKWQAEIPTPKASFKNYVITVSGSSTRILKNVLIGEVWLASGQSNMEMLMKDTNKPIVNNYDAYINTSNNSFIRLFNTQRQASLSPESDVEGVWESSHVNSASGFSAIGYIYARQLFDNLQIPIGIIETSWGGTSISNWLPESIINKYPNYKIPDSLPANQKKPTALYNGMIHPFRNYSIKGFLWYQGESNRFDADIYKDLMTDLVSHWRFQWQDENLPFYFVQIAPYIYNKDKSSVQFLANQLREAQVEAAQDIPNSGIVITTDVGECDEIHPPEKEIIAKRLSRWALNEQYGFKSIPYRSPEYKSVKFRANKAIVQFDFFGKNKDNLRLDSNRELRNFEIAGPDKVFYPAKVKITKNKALTVYSDKVKNPVAVRYGFVDCLEGSLFSKAGLPVSPFRTDDWDQ